MKKILLLICILCSCIVEATDVKSIPVNIDLTGVSFPRDSYGQIKIIPPKGLFAFDSNEDYPCLPFYPVSVYIEASKEYANSNTTYKKTLLFNNCKLAPVPIEIPTSQQQDQPDRISQFEPTIYPSNNVRYTGESQCGNGKILYFQICPFIYEGKENRLYLLSNIQLNIMLNKKVTPKNVQAQYINPGQKELINDLVINNNDINWDNSNLITEWPNKRLDYVIITNNELSGAFTPLVEWKKQKGVWTEVFTIENIEKSYTAESIQEKIKLCLYDLYRERGLKYVLLGGDDSVIPVRYCKNMCIPNGIIPTDLYYSCFGGTFTWDRNNNGIYGESSDSIDILPNVYLSRLPVRTFLETENFANRVVSYEKMKEANLWNKNILMCGYELSKKQNGHSDSEIKGDRLYEEYINKYWNGERKKLYDTYNDFNYTRLYYKAIQEQLSKGYTFADFIMHGAPWCYNMKSDGHYDINDASEQTNSGYTIITTMSCSTNAFDDCDTNAEYKDPCLSEALVRNPNSGIIGYLGCSREGFYNNWGINSFGTSLEYEASFYESMFSNRIANKNLGKIAAYSKSKLIANCKNDNTYRWVQFGLNLIGDPEMPVFTDTPQKIQNPKVKIENNKLNIDTGVDSCTVCVMSRMDSGNSYYKVLNNVRTACLDFYGDSLSLCITKQNYIPFFVSDVLTYYRLTNTIAGNLITGVVKDPIDGSLNINYHVASNSKKANIVVSSYDGTTSKTIPVSVKEDNIRANSTEFNKDILSITLFVDSKKANSILFNNK